MGILTSERRPFDPEPDGRGPRWGQLTYTSFDDGRSGGGWQVKQTTGNLDATEVEFLRSRVITQFEATTALPDFPTPTQIQARPRRLLYARSSGLGGYWHTVPAGGDATGRPGNVFVHAVLDRFADRVGDGRPADFRPIALWGSADWLIPFGPTDVRLAEFGDYERPRDAGVVTRARVVDFVLAPGEFRIGALGVALDAVAAALAGGPKLVLGASSPDTGAMWIGAISHLMGAATCADFAFSTFERATTLSSAFARGLHLAVVPRDDLAQVYASPDWVVLDEAEAVELGEFGGEPHRTAAGSAIAVTAWSGMAEVVLQDHSTADAALAVMDSVAVRVGDVGANPAWPLAMAVGLGGAELAEASTDAAAVILYDSPGALAGHPGLFETASRMTRIALGTTTKDAYTALLDVYERRSGASVLGDLMTMVYLERALADDPWLAHHPENLIPRFFARLENPPPSLAAAIVDRVAQIVEQATGRAPGPRAAAAAALLRLIDFGDRTGMIGSSEREALISSSAEFVCTELMDPGNGPVVATSTPYLSSDTVHTFIAPALRDRLPFGGPIAAGLRLPAAVLDWLFPRPPEPTADVLTVEYALSAYFVPRPTASATGLLPAALYGLLAQAEALRSDPYDRELERHIRGLVKAGVTDSELMALSQPFRHRIPLGAYGDALRKPPWSKAKMAIVSHILDLTEPVSGGPAERPPIERTLASFYHVAVARQWDQSNASANVARANELCVLLAELVAANMGDVHPEPAADAMLSAAAVTVLSDTQRRLDSATRFGERATFSGAPTPAPVGDRLSGSVWSVLTDLARFARDKSVGSQVVTCAMSRAFGQRALLETKVMAREDFPVPISLVSAGQRQLTTVRIGKSAEGPVIIDAVFDDWLARTPYPLDLETFEGYLERTVRTFLGRLEEPRTVDEAVNKCRKYLRAQTQDRGRGGHALSRGIGKLRRG